MPQTLFQFQPVSGKDGPVLETLVRKLNQRKLRYDGVQKKGEGVISVDFSTQEDARNAYKTLDGTEFLGSTLNLKPGNNNDGSHYVDNRNDYSQDQDGYPRQEKYNNKNYQGYNNHGRHEEQYPCRILIPSDMVKVILGKGGATINSIQSKSNTKIDVHRDKGLQRGQPAEDTLTSIKGDPDAFSEAVKEILSVMDREYEKRTHEEKLPLQLKLLAHDLLCGRIIGKGGNNLKQVRIESNVTKLIISNSIYDEGNHLVPHGLLQNMGERVITMEGTLDAICTAEKIISERLRDYMERDIQNSTSNMYPMGGYHSNGVFNDGYNFPPPQFYQRSAYDGYNNPPGMMGYQGYGTNNGFPPVYNNNYPGVVSNGYQPYPPNMMPHTMMMSVDEEETCCILIPTKEVGAVIGRNGGYVSRVKQYSGARVRVVKGEDGGESRVEVTGPPDSQWRASLCIFNKIKETMKVPYSETQLKTEYMVPSDCVGRIIGKKGLVVQDIQDKSNADIEVPKDHKGGENDEVPVYVTGTFNGTQIAVNRIRDIIHRSHPKGP